jgi:pimeloyl-ACP methyl ester carboxylesterase
VALELGVRSRAQSIVAIAADGLGTPFERLRMFDIPSDLGGISCLVLIVHGTIDPLVGSQASRYLAAKPNAHLRWLPGLSHVPISDDPAAVARLLLDFLAGSPPTQSKTAWLGLSIKGPNQAGNCLRPSPS